MKTKIPLLIVGAIVLAALPYYLLPVAEQQANEAVPSGADIFRIAPANYDPLVKAAMAGDCEAAFTLARYHAFATSKYDEAIQWFRIAAKCPHVGAKGELLSMLRFEPEHDGEVDRLLSEMEQLDPKAAASAREAVEMARAERHRKVD